MYLSKDAGKSFKQVDAPVDHDEVTADISSIGTQCQFAATSLQSPFHKNWIYCVHEIQENWEQRDGTLFYTSDLRNSTKVVHELKGLLVSEMRILSSSVLIKTLEDVGDKNFNEKMWNSTSETFKSAYLPDTVASFTILEVHDDLGRVFLEARQKRNENKQLLVSDSLVSKFSFILMPIQDLLRFLKLRKIANINGALWGDFRMFSSNNWTTKKSFDNGETWSNLKNVDPTGKNEKYFECDMNDTAHCSLNHNDNGLIFRTHHSSREPYRRGFYNLWHCWELLFGF